MRLPSSFLFLAGLLVTGVPLFSAACGGAYEVMGDLTACTQTSCPAEETWDALQCACVPIPVTACPVTLSECPAGQQYDPLTCRCVVPHVGVDAGPARPDSTTVACQEAPPVHCVVGYEFNSETCGCSPIPDAGIDAELGCSLGSGSCPSGYVLDEAACECVAKSVDAAVCDPPPGLCAVGYTFSQTACGCVPVDAGLGPDAGEIGAMCTSQLDCASGLDCCGPLQGSGPSYCAPHCGP
jgi:hypothetical protein